MQEIWTTTTENLQKILPERDYSTWVQPIRFVSQHDNIVKLSVPTSFFKEWLEENYTTMFSNALSNVSGYPCTIEFIVDERNDDIYTPDAEELFIDTPEIAPVKNSLDPSSFTPLNKKYTFDLFVNGSSNQFAFAAAMAVAQSPADTYNPLFIYGGVGLGKSHLLNAIGHAINEQRPSASVCYCSAEKFMFEMVNALQKKKMDTFRERFRNVDVLLIDDVQFISGKVGTQEEFFHTFNCLYENHKQIVISSDKFPREIIGLEDRLRSRFEWGLIADIQAPDTETKIAILKKKSEINRIRIPDDVICFLAETDTKNIRELEGMLIRLGAYSSLQNVPITLDMARENLKDILGEKHKEITVELIQKTVGDYFGIKQADLKSEKRLKNLVHARQIAIWLCRDLTKSSYPDIGLRFGGKDHSTVIYAAKKIDNALKSDANLSRTIEEIKVILKK